LISLPSQLRIAILGVLANWYTSLFWLVPVEYVHEFNKVKYPFQFHGEPNISYICSWYYRTRELIFIDLCSVGCVVADLLIGQV